MWPPEALEFLRELEANNDRDWFKANRARYDAHLLEPARELAETLTDLGQPHFFRPYNDTRFHARPPIKEQLGVAVGYGGAGGYYVELSLDGLLVAAGLELARPELKTAPRGYPTTHPRIRFLRLRELTVSRRHALEPWLHAPEARGRIRTELEGARPLVTWLGEHVGPSQRSGDQRGRRATNRSNQASTRR